jgi:hypothetical protein
MQNAGYYHYQHGYGLAKDLAGAKQLYQQALDHWSLGIEGVAQRVM